MSRPFAPPSLIVFTSIVISRPSHSAKAALHRWSAVLFLLSSVLVISTEKLNAMTGSSMTLAMSAFLRDEGPIAALHQPHGEKRHRQRRRDAQLHDEAALVDASSRVQRRTRVDLKRALHGAARKRA